MNASPAQQLFDRWNAALATRNPETVADLYAADAVLLPTLSGRIRTDRQGIVDYFSHFLETKPCGTVTESYVHEHHDLLLHSGHYAFTCQTDSAPHPFTVNARFTFAYRREGNVWKIVAHHSSRLPDDVD